MLGLLGREEGDLSDVSNSIFRLISPLTAHRLVIVDIQLQEKVFVILICLSAVANWAQKIKIVLKCAHLDH